ncbi:SIS domain-containing protein [Nonomuraea africana]|uniref:Glucose/mannose-6-phosphate isomerase n=1 Tax=Nonomuraea africana TaxID=46171 RepID=A0ABR9KUM9_9ACTN|nr:SIS domain-containing protein [Nonomuraea africana]MBE1565742.1 glucose/mannose-6-phosphate isomerase [Nonomuraea africana]
MTWEPERLDDQAQLSAGDPGAMLPAVASAAAQVRTAHRNAGESGVARLAQEGRPRAIVVAGMGAAALAGDILAVLCGYGAPLPVVTVRSGRLPGWVGATDLVMAVSSSGRTAETLSVATEAARRGSSLLAVTAPDSPLHAIATQASALFVPVEPTGPSRANLWGLAVPLVAAADALGLIKAGPDLFEDVAKGLEEMAHRCRPTSESFVNPGKALAMELAESVPVLWGATSLTAIAAHRLALQLHENAKYPAMWGALPEAGHNQLAVVEGPLAERDIFADTAARTVRLVLLRESDERPLELLGIAHDRGVPVTELVAEGAHPLERLATLIELGDYASVYLALGYGVDPTPVAAITELQARISQ